MAHKQLALLVLALCLAAAPGGMAQRAADLMSNLPEPGQLSVVHHFASHPTKQFPAGEVVKVAVSAHNDGSKPYNLSAIMGSLNSPTNYNMFLYNFTEAVYFTPIAPGEEVTLEYLLRTDPATPPREFLIALHLFYENAEGGMHAATFFNGTVEIVEPPRLVDTDLLFMWATLAAIAAALGYWAYTAASERFGFKLTKPKRKAARKADGAKAPIDEDEWVKGTHYDLNKRKKATQRNKSGGNLAAQAAQ